LRPPDGGASLKAMGGSLALGFKIPLGPRAAQTPTADAGGGELGCEIQSIGVFPGVRVVSPRRDAGRF
jgi:hypothetical protein